MLRGRGRDEDPGDQRADPDPTLADADALTGEGEGPSLRWWRRWREHEWSPLQRTVLISAIAIVAGAATADSGQALTSLGTLARLDAATALTGHGPAWSGSMSEAAERAMAAGSA